MASKRDYYEILGVVKTADGEEIRRAYRQERRRPGPAVHGDDRALARVVEQDEGARGCSIDAERVPGIDAMLLEFGQEMLAHRVPADRADEAHVMPGRAEPAGDVGRASSDAPAQRLGIDVVARGGDALNTQNDVCRNDAEHNDFSHVRWLSFIRGPKTRRRT